LRVDPDLDAKFEGYATRLNQSASNLLVMLMDALIRAMDQHGQVIMPLQIKTPADCAPAAVHTEHNGVGHQMLRVAESGSVYHHKRK